MSPDLISTVSDAIQVDTCDAARSAKRRVPGDRRALFRPHGEFRSLDWTGRGRQVLTRLFLPKQPIWCSRPTGCLGEINQDRLWIIEMRTLSQLEAAPRRDEGKNPNAARHQTHER